MFIPQTTCWKLTNPEATKSWVKEFHLEYCFCFNWLYPLFPRVIRRKSSSLLFLVRLPDGMHFHWETYCKCPWNGLCTNKNDREHCSSVCAIVEDGHPCTTTLCYTHRDSTWKHSEVSRGKESFRSYFSTRKGINSYKNKFTRKIGVSWQSSCQKYM